MTNLLLRSPLPSVAYIVLHYTIDCRCSHLCYRHNATAAYCNDHYHCHMTDCMNVLADRCHRRHDAYQPTTVVVNDDSAIALADNRIRCSVIWVKLAPE